MTEYTITTVHKVLMDEDNQEDVASIANLLAKGANSNVDSIVQSVETVELRALPVAKVIFIDIEEDQPLV